MKHLTDISRILFSLSIVALSASIAYFTYEVSRVRTDLPELLTQLNETTEIVGPVLEQTSEITKLIPPILEEVKQTRELIPPIIKEVSEIRKEIPAILHEIEETRKVLPDVLKEVKLTRKQIPPILKEVKATRESLPVLIDDANKLVDKARVAGKEASSGAVTGFFSGIFTAPFAIVGDIGSTVFKLNDSEKKQYNQDDLNQVYEVTLELLNSEKEGATKKAVSKDGKINTIITLTDIDNSGEFPCKTLHFYSVKEGNVISDKISTVCKNAEGKWDNNS